MPKSSYISKYTNNIVQNTRNLVEHEAAHSTCNTEHEWKGIVLPRGKAFRCAQGIILPTRSPIFRSLLCACQYLALNIDDENKITKATHAINTPKRFLGMLCRHQGIVIREKCKTRTIPKAKRKMCFPPFCTQASYVVIRPAQLGLQELAP